MGKKDEAPSPDSYTPDWVSNPDQYYEEKRANYDKYFDQLAGLQEQMPTMPDLSEQYSGMQGLIDRLQAGPTAEDQNEALAFAARQAGFDNVEEYQNWMQGMRPRDISEYQGLSEEERAQLEKQKRFALREQNESMRLAVEATMGATGSWTRGMAQADAMAQDIANTALKYDVEIANQDFARKMAQQETQTAAYFQAYQTGSMSATQFLQTKWSGIQSALGGYYQQANLMLQEYGAEVQTIAAQAEMIRDTALMEVGIDSQIYEQMNQEFEMAMAPYYVELENWERSQEETPWGKIVGGFMIVTGLALAPFTGGTSLSLTAAGGSMFVG